jgi:ribosome-binding factor A
LRPTDTAAHLRDAAHYITKLPKAEHDAEEWQAAMQALLLVVEQLLHLRADWQFVPTLTMQQLTARRGPDA